MSTRDHRRNDRRHERGAALLISMMLLMAMALIGFASLNTVMREREVTGYTNQGQMALYGADAALASSLDVLRKAVLPQSFGAGYCLTSPNLVPSLTMPNGVSYGPDTTLTATAQRICNLSTAELCDSMGVSLDSPWLKTVWNVRTQGTAPTGAVSRIQSTIERCHAFQSQYGG